MDDEEPLDDDALAPEDEEVAPVELDAPEDALVLEDEAPPVEPDAPEDALVLEDEAPPLPPVPPGFLVLLPQAATEKAVAASARKAGRRKEGGMGGDVRGPRNEATEEGGDAPRRRGLPARNPRRTAPAERVRFCSRRGGTPVARTREDPEAGRSTMSARSPHHARFSIVAAALAAAALTSMGCAGARSASDADPRLPPLKEPLAAFGAASLGGAIYVLGGHLGPPHHFSTASESGALERLELAPGSAWEDLGAVSPGVEGAALAAHHGLLYRVGGLRVDNAPGKPEDLHSVKTVQRYDPASGRWEDLTPLPEGRSAHGAAVVGDRLYVVGGWTLDGDRFSGKFGAGGFVLDLARPDAAWQPIPPPPFERRSLAVAAVGDDVYAIGGATEVPGAFSDEVYVLDTRTGAWSRGPKLPARSWIAGFGAAAMLDGTRPLRQRRGRRVPAHPPRRPLGACRVDDAAAHLRRARLRERGRARRAGRVRGGEGPLDHRRRRDDRGARADPLSAAIAGLSARQRDDDAQDLPGPEKDDVQGASGDRRFHVRLEAVRHRILGAQDYCRLRAACRYWAWK